MTQIATGENCAMNPFLQKTAAKKVKSSVLRYRRMEGATFVYDEMMIEMERLFRRGKNGEHTQSLGCGSVHEFQQRSRYAEQDNLCLTDAETEATLLRVSTHRNQSNDQCDIRWT